MYFVISWYQLSCLIVWCFAVEKAISSLISFIKSIVCCRSHLAKFCLIPRRLNFDCTSINYSYKYLFFSNPIQLSCCWEDATTRWSTSDTQMIIVNGPVVTLYLKISIWRLRSPIFSVLIETKIRKEKLEIDLCLLSIVHCPLSIVNCPLNPNCNNQFSLLYLS